MYHAEVEKVAVLFYMFSIKPRKDLSLIQPGNHGNNVIDHSESVFIEIILPNSSNIIVGNIYHAHKTDVDLFNNDLSNCLDHIVSEKKELLYVLKSHFQILWMSMQVYPKAAS